MYLIFGGYNHNQKHTNTGGMSDIIAIKKDLSLWCHDNINCGLDYFEFETCKSLTKPNFTDPFLCNKYYHTGYSWIQIFDTLLLKVHYFNLRHLSTLNNGANDSFCIEHYYKRHAGSSTFSESNFICFDENRKPII